MSSDILTRQNGEVLEITLNHPERGNAVSDEMVVELTGLIARAPQSCEILVLRGAGSDFCVGRAPQPARERLPEALEWRGFSDVVFDCYGALRATSVPVIAVVQGGAFGFGCAVAAACDITLAGDQARFQVPEMAHNILPTMVMSALIDRLPRKAISYLTYSTAVIDAARALELGLASEVVPAAGLEAALASLCSAMLRAPRPALRGVKEFIRHAPDMSVPGAVEYARNLHAVMNASTEMRKKR
jgi:enoyl-CoA hydratase